MIDDHQSESSALELARRLREAREYLQLSQQFVAQETGLSRSAISDIERGARRVGSLELRRLSRLYGYSMSYFVDEPTGSDLDNSTINALARAASELSDDDKNELLNFARFLRHNGRGKGPSGK